MSNAAQPGWYPDPERPGTERWWDGQAWGQIRPAAGMPPAPATPPPPQAAITPACSICGAQGTLVTKQEPITTKKRPKFGVFWILVSLISLGLGLILYLIWPRHKETIGVDRWTECRQCGARV